MANSVDPDETPRSAASHLGLYCLLRPVCPNTYGKYGTFFLVFPIKQDPVFWGKKNKKKYFKMFSAENITQSPIFVSVTDILIATHENYS